MNKENNKHGSTSHLSSRLCCVPPTIILAHVTEDRRTHSSRRTYSVRPFLLSKTKYVRRYSVLEYLPLTRYVCTYQNYVIFNFHGIRRKISFRWDPNSNGIRTYIYLANEAKGRCKEVCAKVKRKNVFQQESTLIFIKD